MDLHHSYSVQELKTILSFSYYSVNSRWTKNCFNLIGYSTFSSRSGTGMCSYRQKIEEHLSSRKNDAIMQFLLVHKTLQKSLYLTEIKLWLTIDNSKIYVLLEQLSASDNWIFPLIGVPYWWSMVIFSRVWNQPKYEIVETAINMEKCQLRLSLSFVVVELRGKNLTDLREHSGIEGTLCRARLSCISWFFDLWSSPCKSVRFY